MRSDALASTPHGIRISRQDGWSVPCTSSLAWERITRVTERFPPCASADRGRNPFRPSSGPCSARTVLLWAVAHRFGTRTCARAPLRKRSSSTTSSFRCSSSSANGLWPAPIAIGTVDSWYSSTRPRRVSDLAKSGPPWTRTVPSSSRAFRSAIRAQVPAEDLGRSPSRLLQGVGEDSLRLLVHRRCDRPLGRGPVRAHDLVAAAAHRVNAGLLERAEVSLVRVVAEPLEHPFMGPVGAGGKPVEGQTILRITFLSLMEVETYPPRVNSSLIGDSGVN